MAIQDLSPIYMSGSGFVNVSFANTVYLDYISMEGTLSSEVSMVTSLYMSQVNGEFTLDSNISPLGFSKLISPVVMRGTLDAAINSARSLISCTDISIDLLNPELVVDKCGAQVCSSNKGNYMKIQRFLNDTYPVVARLSVNGDYDISGFSFTFHTKLKNESVYSTPGIIEDAENGKVSFALVSGSTGSVGKGHYDIEGTDGTYIYTFVKDIYEVVEDVS